MNRRHCLARVGGSLASLAAPRWVRAHGDVGPVSPPIAVPNIPVTDELGRRGMLRDRMVGKLTVVQTIFTGCSSVCPIQGALFAQAQQRLATQAPRLAVAWLSIGIDALGDTPESLRRWLLRMGPPQAAWSAVVPRPDGIDLLVRTLDGATAPPAQAVDDHSDKVYVVDPQARLCWRTGSLPPVDELVRLVSRMAA